MSRGRPQGDYGQRMPDSGLTGFEPDDDDRRREDQPQAGRGADPSARAWPYNQEPGYYGAGGSADADGYGGGFDRGVPLRGDRPRQASGSSWPGSGESASGTDWQPGPAPQRGVEPWDTPLPVTPQRPSGDRLGAADRGRDSWTAGQDFARPWAADEELGGPRGPGYGNWTPPGPAAAPASARPSLPASPRRPAELASFSPGAAVTTERSISRDADADLFGYDDAGTR
jgi:hypothetical protein